jgi:hypothetical protein
MNNFDNIEDSRTSILNRLFILKMCFIYFLESIRSNHKSQIKHQRNCTAVYQSFPEQEPRQATLNKDAEELLPVVVNYL